MDFETDLKQKVKYEARCMTKTHFMILTRKQLWRVQERLNKKQNTKDVKFLKLVNQFSMLPKRVLTKMI